MTKKEFWQQRVRPVAEKCYLDAETYRLQYKCKMGFNLTKREEELYNHKRNEYKDLFLPYNIQEMVKTVEKSLKTFGAFGDSLECVKEVTLVLRRPVYFDNHFGEERQGEHCQHLLELRKALFEFWAIK